MIALSLGEIADITGGVLTGPGGSDAAHYADPEHASTMVTGTVEFDSRKITVGGLFLALAGDRVDGHTFAPAAYAAGAVAALTSRPVEGVAIVVPDVLVALGALARAVLERLLQLTVVGITGSSGKTSTKDLMAAVVEQLGPTVAPHGSFNNELGHPYTVLRCDEHTRYLILEKSARGLGHITWLTQIAPPRIGVVLNVGSAHIGEFGSIDITAKAKGELVEALPDAGAGGVAVLNADDPVVVAMADRTNARVLRYGVGPFSDTDTVDIWASNVVLNEHGRAAFTLHTPHGSANVALALHGEHHVSNALAVAAVAIELGASLPELAQALSAAGSRSPGRMQVTRRGDGVTVIDDSYNANPDSMRAGLRALRAMAPQGERSTVGGLVDSSTQAGRTWAVLGYMAELGQAERAEHAALGFTVAELGIDRLVVIGEPAQAMHTAAVSKMGTWHGSSVLLADTAAALALLREQLRPGDVVLVKASRAARLERVALGLLKPVSLLEPLGSLDPASSLDDRQHSDKEGTA
ncbi:MAG: UDP-N-acetylmuramoyl-tripeptide--D-alanyl-D-alanine ligase [Acidimicrobiales bacterium]|nr:MAG: UDP-N-acetylmuramoyl-tripeptide--D-alanyl-D-alanine ligase [Acidimicrobiales bacterium]